jgi:hypothetical protein
MSEIERLVTDLRNKEDLRGRVLHDGASIDSILRAANENGYSISRSEADAWLAAQQSTELDDASLNAVSAGSGNKGFTQEELAKSVGKGINMNFSNLNFDVGDKLDFGLGDKKKKH